MRTPINPVTDTWRPPTIADFGPAPFVLASSQIVRVAGLDLRDRFGQGQVRSMLGAAPSGSPWSRLLQSVASRFAETSEPAKHAPHPTADLPPDAAIPEPLSQAELELLRRMDGELSDDDVDKLVDLRSRTAGNDRVLVERVLGDAYQRRFESQKAAYVADLKKRAPTPVAAVHDLRSALERFLVERLAEEVPDLRPNEVKARAREQLDEAAEATTSKWKARVEAAEALTPPAIAVPSTGLERGRQRARAQRTTPGSFPGSRLSA